MVRHRCETQDDVDYYWDALSQSGEEGPCGWLSTSRRFARRPTASRRREDDRCRRDGIRLARRPRGA
ncbi:MAG: VOC family protein [Solirubrobacterales bacterium]|nr:VOC family protein [Solirubrobacterales bacterium]